MYVPKKVNYLQYMGLLQDLFLYKFTYLINTSNGIILIFSEFLTGFHKRKLARKKKAKDDFEKKLKEEKKRIKAEVNNKFVLDI